jgi:hypothetical protein
MKKIEAFADLDWHILDKIEKSFLKTHETEVVWHKEKEK